MDRLTLCFIAVLLMLSGCATPPRSYQQTNPRCDQTTGAIVGGVVGALVGTQVGAGRGNKVAIAAGAIGGAVAGQKYCE